MITVPAIDIIGDVHGCFDELLRLLDSLGYVGTWNNGDPKVFHPKDRQIVFAGDLTDRGPDSVAVLRLVQALLKHGHHAVMGNHDDKLYRALKGNPVKREHGLAETMRQIDARCSPEERTSFKEMLENLPYQLTFEVPDIMPVTVVHAGIPFEYVGKDNKKVRSHAIYGEVHGFNEEGIPVQGESWVASWQDKDHWLVHGRTVVPEVTVQKNIINVNTGACFGGKLTALRWPEMEYISVQAVRNYSETLLIGA